MSWSLFPCGRPDHHRPLIVFHFGHPSVVSLLTNLLILPVQPLIMIVDGLATLAGMIWLPLTWSVCMLELTAPLPFASLDLGTFPLWLPMLMYAAIAAGIWVANRPA